MHLDGSIPADDDDVLRINRVEHVRGYEIRVEFSDGVVKDVDLSRELYGEVFEPLRDPRSSGRWR